MASSKEPQNARPVGTEPVPAWADGLKQLYDDVVEEPLPDAFNDLLAQLDAVDDPVPAENTPSGRGGS